MLQKEVDDAIEIIKVGFEKKNEELMLKRWMLHYQDQMTFSEFKSKLGVPSSTTNQCKNNRTKDEIMEDVESMLKNW